MSHEHAWPTVFVVFVVLFASASVDAQTTWYVDDDAPNDPGPGDPTSSDPLEDGSAAHPFDAIQEGVDAAVNGDTVLVLDGTYTGVGNRDVELSGRLITVRSQNGPAACIIDCEQSGRAFRFAGVDSTGAVVEGFTTTNGHGTGWGGGAMLLLDAGRPTVIGCVFIENDSTGDGGGAVATVIGQPEFIGCRFINNSADYQGGAVLNMGYVTLVDCLFSGNSVTSADPADGGGGIYILSSAATITNCGFEGNSARHGGAIYLSASHATLTDCDFSGNTASARGGAIHNLGLHHSPPKLERCTFTGNRSDWDGGAIYNGDDAMITLSDCTFTANSSTSGGGAVCNISCSAIVVGSAFSRNGSFYGGAVYNQSSNPTVMSCQFDGNTASQGGAIYNVSSSPMITNGAFSGNSAEYGGGIMVDTGSPDVTDCTFCGNEATTGGGLLNWFGAPALANCVFWGDAGGEIVDLAGMIAVGYSDVQGGWPGTGNIDADPLVMTTPDAGPDGVWGTEDDDYGDLRLQAGSPCIDAADNTRVPPDTADLDGDADTTERTPLDVDFRWRFVDDPAAADTGIADPPDYPAVVDMGACEFQVPVFGDLDGDFDVDGEDFAILGECMSGPGVSYPPGCDGSDFDGDGDVDLADFRLFQQQFTGPLP